MTRVTDLTSQLFAPVAFRSRILPRGDQGQGQGQDPCALRGEGLRGEGRSGAQDGSACKKLRALGHSLCLHAGPDSESHRLASRGHGVTPLVPLALYRDARSEPAS
eukprot:1938542-Rhodomonas_salina.1